MNWPAVDNLLDLVGNVWIGLVVLGASVIPSWLSARNHKSIKAETQVIKDQLVNGHTKTVLRQDLDRVIAVVEGLAHDVAALRQDLAMEQDSRRSQIDDLRGDVDRMRRR